MPHSLIRKINTNQLKIFATVYRLESMTLAAQELYLTQSGVSQHIKKLEHDIGVTLFIRSKSHFFATNEAEELFKACERAFMDIESTLMKINRSSPKTLEGIIRVGAPTEFGNNILIPYISEWSKRYPLVKFDLVYGYGTHLSELLTNDELDFAFIDSFKEHKPFNSEIIYHEDLNLVTSINYLKTKNINVKSSTKEKLTFFHDLDFIEYEHKESILRMWFQYHYGKKNIPLNIKVWAMNVQGVTAFVKAGMGAAVLPNHVIHQITKEGTLLHTFKGAKETLKNKISLVWLKNKPFSSALTEFKKFIIDTSNE